MIAFDHPDRHFRLALKLTRQGAADIPAADNHHSPGLGLVMAKSRHGARDVVGLSDEINLIPQEHLIIGVRDHELVFAHDAYDLNVQVGNRPPS